MAFASSLLKWAVRALKVAAISCGFGGEGPVWFKWLSPVCTGRSVSGKVSRQETIKVPRP